MQARPQPPADLLPVQREATPMFRLIKLTAGPLLHAVFRIDLDGRHNIPTDRNYVLIANHLSWLDALAILAEFPSEPRVHFLVDTTILATRRFQWALVKSVAGFIPVNRKLHSDAVLFQHVDKCLQRGGVVALFPEGNLGPGEGDLLPFKKGFAHFAIDNHVPVLPVALSGMRDLWLRKTVHMIVGAPIETGGQTVEGLVAIAETRMRELVPPYSDPGGTKLLRNRLTHLF